MSTCRLCGADIEWLEMHPSGKRMPANSPGEKRLVRLPDGDGRAVLVDAYLPHWATCPKAAEARKEKP